ncbi:MAG: cytochrome c [Thiohalomonadaceae bacterium]
MKRIAFILLTLAFAAGCDREPGGHPAEVARLKDPALIARGGALFGRHCASCHGARAEGTPDWRRRDAEGYFPPPPLDDTAHAWHHPLQDLRTMIRRGSLPGQGRMPGWGGKLSEEDIDALIAWIQSLWSAEVYAAWLEIDRRARTP